MNHTQKSKQTEEKRHAENAPLDNVPYNSVHII